MHDIFISYASDDRPRVKPLVDALQKRGWSVWWDRTIRAGRTFDQVIDAALNDARCVIVLWSDASIDSDWVRTEADEGKRRGILVPALLDDVDAFKIPLAFRRIQAANLVGWSGALPSAQFDEVALAVSDVLSDSAPPVLDVKQAPARDMYNLGWVCEHGYGVDRDYKQAVSWYRKAAEAGDAQGMARLGHVYRNGFGVDKDERQALAWNRKAVEAGSAQGMNNLGVMYEDGTEVAKDLQKAISWYRKAVQLGDETAKSNLKRLGESA